MRWRERRQCLDQTSLCTRSKVRVHVRALLGSMSERVVAERSKPNRAATAPSSVKGDPDRRGRRPLDPHDAVRFRVKSTLATAGSPWRKADLPCLTGFLRCRSLTYMATGSGDGKPVT